MYIRTSCIGLIYISYVYSYKEELIFFAVYVRTVVHYSPTFPSKNNGCGNTPRVLLSVTHLHDANASYVLLYLQPVAAQHSHPRRTVQQCCGFAGHSCAPDAWRWPRVAGYFCGERLRATGGSVGGRRGMDKGCGSRGYFCAAGSLALSWMLKGFGAEEGVGCIYSIARNWSRR